jgi:hypothetical protein
MNKSTISMALATLVFQAGVSSAANVIVNNPETIVTPWTTYPPGGFATLTTTSPFTSGTKYAGVFFGTVDGAKAAFFCAELNHPVYYGVSHPLNVNVLEEAPIHDGNPVGSPTPAPTPLSERQLCLLEGVYAYLKVYNPDGYTTNTGTQDLTGTSTAGVGGIATMAGLTDITATAAQLVMWEIIHEAGTGTAPFTGVPTDAISLTGGKLQWSNFKGAALGNTFDVGLFNTEFNNIANYAVNTWTCVPEITSPVALIFGGLVFVRRREPRALRLKSLAP